MSDCQSCATVEMSPADPIFMSRGENNSQLKYKIEVFMTKLSTDFQKVYLIIVFVFASCYGITFERYDSTDIGFYVKRSFALSKKDEVRIQMHSLQGKEIGNKTFEPFQSGCREVVFDCSEFASGFYVVSVMIGNARFLHKVILN